MGDELYNIHKVMADAVEEYVKETNEHFSNEIATLTEMGIKEEEACVLCTDEYKIMYDRMYLERMHCKTYVLEGDNVRVMARAIWVGLKTLKIMKEVLANGLPHHSALSAAFVRCLTRKLGKGDSGGNKSLSALVEEAKKEAVGATKEVKELRKDVEKAGRNIGSADGRLQKVTDKLELVINKNSLKIR